MADLINVLTAPADTFKSLLERNHWQEALKPILVLVILSFFTYWLLQDLYADAGWEQASQRIADSTRIPEDQKNQVLEKTYDRIYNPSTGNLVFTYTLSAISWPIRIGFMALLAMLLGNLFFGGGIPYSRVFLATAFAYCASIIEYLVKTPLQYFTQNAQVFTGLGLLDLGEKGSFINTFFVGMDLFSFWRVLLIAIAMGILYKKNTKHFLYVLIIVWILQLLFFTGLGALLS
ncbi:MAG: YIP1 family protein [Fidelibacterota bacterium]